MRTLHINNFLTGVNSNALNLKFDVQQYVHNFTILFSEIYHLSTATDDRDPLEKQSFSCQETCGGSPRMHLNTKCLCLYVFDCIMGY